MKPQNIVIALALVTAGAGLTAVAEWPVASQPPAAVAEPDFTVLHRQASEALDKLREAQLRRNSAGFVAF